MDFISKNIEDYCISNSKDLNSVLDKLERETQLKVMRPRMLSGKLQGKFLEQIVKMTSAKNILEIGTYTGYSAICMASALTDDGVLHTIDINAELESMANKYFKLAKLEHKIEMHIGDALQIIPNLNLSFDLVFIDADKHNYSNYYDLLIDKLPSGALILADNVLWSGKVLDIEHNNDRETIAIDKFNKKITNDPRVDNMLLPLRDGVMMIRKK
ncbi:MAG: methyltransferase [Bacteroidetes bacterium 4572_112]|nr:MAG: methyltransferase [Bacteroidetes bacterium 4572_112]